jgi:hypothetical protein
MTIQPYDRKRAVAPLISHAEYWVAGFDTGTLGDGTTEVDAAALEEIVITPYYVYSEMPSRWNANWYFKTDMAGTTKTATIYTNKNNTMGIIFQ